MLGLGTLTRVLKEVRSDVATARDRDPAARDAGSLEILAAWGGVQAILSHRFAHALHEAGIPLAPDRARLRVARRHRGSRSTRRRGSARSSSSTTARAW